LLTLAQGWRARLSPGQRYIRGLFSSGTLCYEAQVVLRDQVGPAYSNAPLDPAYRLPDPHRSQGHTCLDLGEEEFTQGRPHPMIDFDLRARRIVREAEDPETAVLLLDVVLGYGVHPDPIVTGHPPGAGGGRGRRPHAAHRRLRHRHRRRPIESDAPGGDVAPGRRLRGGIQCSRGHDGRVHRHRDLRRGGKMRRRIAVNPNIHFGKPCVAGTRIPVRSVLELIGEGLSFAEIIRDYYPDLTVEDIRACIQYAMEVIAAEDIHIEAVAA